jgi:hypothetical protein
MRFQKLQSIRTKPFSGCWTTCIYACIWTSRIDFGHGFDALPGTSTQMDGKPTLLLDNNSSIAIDFQIL